MTNDDNGDRRPLEVVGALVAIGAVGGSRGQLALRRLKWLASQDISFAATAMIFAFISMHLRANNLHRAARTGRYHELEAVQLYNRGDQAQAQA